MATHLPHPGFAPGAPSTTTAPEREPTEEHPLGGYLVLTGGFLALTAGSAFALRHKLPRPARRGQLLVSSLATFALARIATRDKVTSFLRSPFAKFEKTAGAGEVDEQPRGTGLRRAVGELVTCPYCATPWMATAVTLGSVASPRAAGMLTRAFATVAVSWFLHQAYALLRKEA